MRQLKLNKHIKMFFLFVLVSIVSVLGAVTITAFEEGASYGIYVSSSWIFRRINASADDSNLDYLNKTGFGWLKDNTQSAIARSAKQGYFIIDDGKQNKCRHFRHFRRLNLNDTLKRGLLRVRISKKVTEYPSYEQKNVSRNRNSH